MKIELAKQLVREAKRMLVALRGLPFRLVVLCQELIEKIESHGKDWLSVLKSDRKVEFVNKKWRIDELHEEVELTDRKVVGKQSRV